MRRATALAAATLLTRLKPLRLAASPPVMARKAPWVAAALGPARIASVVRRPESARGVAATLRSAPVRRTRAAMGPMRSAGTAGAGRFHGAAEGRSVMSLRAFPIG